MLEEFYYLFITDPLELFIKPTYAEYEAREPGYGRSWLRAYNVAFQMPKNKTITKEFLFMIQKEAMGFQVALRAGSYRGDSVYFPIRSATFYDLPSEYDFLFNSSSEGISEFIDYWFFKTPKPIHYMTFMPNKEITWRVSAQIDNKIKWTCLVNNGQMSEEWLSLEESKEKIEKFWRSYKCNSYIQCMPEVNCELIPAEIDNSLTRIIEEFDEEIPTATSDHEIITVIAKHIQHIAQLHPFIDGNIRTCYILLNKLLRDYDLSLSILLNANRLDCCSLQEVVDMIEQGQEYYQQLLLHQKGDFNFNSKLEGKTFMINPEPLRAIDRRTVENFSANVIMRPQIPTSHVSYKLFAQKLAPQQTLEDSSFAAPST